MSNEPFIVFMMYEHRAGTHDVPWFFVACLWAAPSIRSPVRSRKPYDVMALLALQPTACRSDRARNREFQTTGTGNS